MTEAVVNVRVKIAVCDECPARLSFVDGYVDPRDDEIVVAVPPGPDEEMGTVIVHKRSCSAAPDLSQVPSQPSTASEVLGNHC